MRKLQFMRYKFGVEGALEASGHPFAAAASGVAADVASSKVKNYYVNASYYHTTAKAPNGMTVLLNEECYVSAYWHSNKTGKIGSTHHAVHWR